MKRSALFVLSTCVALSLAFTVFSCSDEGTSQGVADASVPRDTGTPVDDTGGGDAGPDEDFGVVIDAGAVDAGIDASGEDAGPEGGTDGGFDAGEDADPDAAFDGGMDAGADAGFDAGVESACIDIGPQYPSYLKAQSIPAGGVVNYCFTINTPTVSSITVSMNSADWSTNSHMFVSNIGNIPLNEAERILNSGSNYNATGSPPWYNLSAGSNQRGGE